MKARCKGYAALIVFTAVFVLCFPSCARVLPEPENAADRSQLSESSAEAQEKQDSSTSNSQSAADDLREETENSTDTAASASSDASLNNKGETASKSDSSKYFSDSSGSGTADSGQKPSGVSQAECRHTWVTRTETKREPVKTIVTSEKHEYTLYRFYWYSTDEWEETRDPERFDEWEHSEDGGLYPLLHPFAVPEDAPLFTGYDKNGHETYTNNHTIIEGLFEEIPCEPYEKTEMVTVTTTTIVCSKCGAVK